MESSASVAWSTAQDGEVKVRGILVHVENANVRSTVAAHNSTDKAVMADNFIIFPVVMIRFRLRSMTMEFGLSLVPCSVKVCTVVKVSDLLENETH